MEVNISDLKLNQSILIELKKIKEIEFINFSSSSQLKSLKINLNSSQNWFDFTLTIFNLGQSLNNNNEKFINNQFLINWLLLNFENNKFIESLSLNKINKLVQLLVPWLLEFINGTNANGGEDSKFNNINSKKYLGDRLRCLDLIILTWGLPCVKYQTEIITTILNLTNSIQSINNQTELTTSNLHILRYCLNIGASFCHKFGSKLDPPLIDKLITTNLNLTLNYLQNNRKVGLPNLDNLVDNGNSLSSKLSIDKFIKSSLRSLLPAIKFKKQKLTNKELELILSLSHQCLFWGILTTNEWKSYQIKKHSKLITVRVNSIEEFQNFLNSKEIQKFNYLSESDWLTGSSDNNLSNNGGGSGVNSLIKEEIRLFSLKLIKIIFEKRKDQLINYSKELLPFSNFSTNLSLVYTILNDPSNQVKQFAIEFIEFLLDNCTNYLGVAISSRENSSFTTFSESIGNQLVILQQGLLNLLDSMKFDFLKINIFKCLKLMLLNCNFQKLKLSLIGDYIELGVRFIELESIDYQIIGWNLLELVLISNTKLDQKFNYFNNQRLINNNEQSIIDFALDNLRNSSKLGTLVKVNICKLVPKFVGFKWIKWYRIQPLITELMDHEDHLIRVEAFRILIPLLENSHLSESEYTQSLNDSIFDQYLPLSTCDNNPCVKAIAAELLSYYPLEVFEALEEPIKIYSITILLGWAKDDNYQVIADCFKTLGVWVNFPTLLQNEALILDLIQINLESLQNPNLLVRVKSSWCLANICDKLIELESSANLMLIHQNNPKWNEILVNLINCGVCYCKDHDKIKGNGVRILGRIGKLLPYDVLTDNEFILEEIMNSLFNCFCSGLVKTRWNSILSIGQLYQNDHFIELTNQNPWHKDLIDKMFSTLIQSHNYKFKTHILSSFTFILPNLTLNYLLFTLFELVKFCNILSLNKSSVMSGEFGHWNGMLNQIEELKVSINDLITNNSYKGLLLTKSNPNSSISDKEIQLSEVNEDLTVNLSKLKLD